MMNFWFKNTKKDIVMTIGDEKDSEIKNNCQFCEKRHISDKVRGFCHLAGKYKGPDLVKVILLLNNLKIFLLVLYYII